MMTAITTTLEPLYAAGIESLVMPGKLVDGHAKYEDECSNCHQPFSKESQAQLCRDCHEDIDRDIRDQRGYHGRTHSGETQCRHCHTDHKGRNKDIVQLNTETFDHDGTDYALKGAHNTTGCGACHANGKKYRDAPPACVDCHRKDDVHEEKLGDDCAQCHIEKSWKPQPFDHEDTDFPLHGKHADIDCNSCHAGQQYRELSTTCYSCHRLNDVHGGRYGNSCSDCHREQDWSRIDFDHDKNTEYPLTGKHRKVQCDTCHKDGLKKDLETECIACHRGDDEHRGQYGRQCNSCHVTRGWDKPVFKHDGETGFPLLGKHTDVRCAACHRGEPGKENLGTKCIACHRPDDVHAGQEGEQCESCHRETGWGDEIRFDHDLARFPLIGMHAVAPCEECHLSAAFQDAKLECLACHRTDDVHKQKLGKECADCHNPNAWSLWEFDHNAHTKFQLDGGHEGIDCLACHTRPVTGEISLPSSCVACHRQDDIHDGNFGRYCNQCHNSTAFDEVEIR